MDLNEQASAIGSRLVALRQKLRAREGKSGYEKNCEMIREEIKRLEDIAAQTISRTTIADSDGDDGA